jgi:hypothetical protein
MNGFSCLLRKTRAVAPQGAPHPLRQRVAKITMLGGLWLVALNSHPAASSGQVLQTIALRGQPAPDAPGAFFGPLGTSFSAQFHQILLNNAGEVALQWSLTPNGNDYGHFGVWAGPIGDLNLIVHGKMQAPGGAEYDRFHLIEDLIFGDGGHIAFYGDLESSTRIYDGIWSTKAGTLELVAKPGIQQEGGLAGRFIQFQTFLPGPAIDRSGNVAFHSEVQGAASILSDRSDSLAVEVRVGGAAHGTTGVYRSLVGVLAMSSAGDLLFSGVVEDGDKLTTGIWVDTGSGLSPLIDDHQSVPDMPSSEFATIGPGSGGVAFHIPSINRNGEVAFVGRLKTDVGGVTADDNVGIWAESDGAFNLVARTGDSPANVPSEVFGSFAQVQLSQSGELTFTAWLRSPDGTSDPARDRSIFVTRAGALELVAREGNEAPTTDLDTTFKELGWSWINGRGQVAFQASLDSDANPASGILDSLWATSLTGELRLIARRGDLMDVDSGSGVDLREIATVGLGGFLEASAGAESGWPSAFNDRGQIAFVATFTDGASGAFVSNLVAIPEPGGAVMLTAAWGVMMAAARQQRTAWH